MSLQQSLFGHSQSGHSGIKPDLYCEKSLRQALRQGKPLSQAVTTAHRKSKLSPIYTMKKSLRHATHDMSLRHATAMADLYYFVASPVQLVENTHD